MALNFPLNPDDQSIYIDPVSGLKYIFNKAIGGWETAIQPPVIVTEGIQPDITIEGFLWWDNAARNLYILRNGQWTPVAGDTDGTTTVTVSSDPPPSPTQGDLWWDNAGGTLYIYYVDNDSPQWVIAAPNLNTDDRSVVYTGLTSPDQPLQGDMWFNTANNELLVYHNGNWVSVVASNSGISSVTGIVPILTNTVQGATTISIRDASTTEKGAARYATQQEVSAKINDSVAISPYRLAVGIDGYLPDATESTRGVMKIATESQMIQLADDTVAVTPAKLQAAIQSTGNPTGSIITYANIVPPNGYLLCNGDILPSVTDNYIGYVKDGILVPVGTANSIAVNFQALRSVLGTTYSSNDTDVLLPDLRGVFIRSYHHDKPGIDSGRVYGSYQNQSIQTHNHSLIGGPADVAPTGANYGGGNRTTNTGTYQTDNAGTGETRPNNICLTYCIKY